MIELLINWLRKKNRMRKLLSSVNKIGIKGHLINAKHMRDVLNLVEPSDVILTRAFAEITTVLQGSTFTHSAMKSDIEDEIIHAIGMKGVHRADILALYPGTERICIKRVRANKEQKELILKLANNYADAKIPYDFNFEFRDENFMSCSEFINWCVNTILRTLKFVTRLNFETYIPDDIFFDDDNFETIYDSGEINNG